jgi:hypothetical protein
MNVRTARSVAAALAMVWLISLSSCSSLRFWCWGCGDDTSDAQVHQVVLVWLKLPGNPTHRSQVIEAFDFFENSPGVVAVHTGQAVLSNRRSTDDSFDVAATLSFKSRAELQRFVEDRERQQVMEDTIEPFAARVVIHEFIEPYD